MRISDGSSDVCSSDLLFFNSAIYHAVRHLVGGQPKGGLRFLHLSGGVVAHARFPDLAFLDQAGNFFHGFVNRGCWIRPVNLKQIDIISFQPSQTILTLFPEARSPCIFRSEEHTSELQSLMRISYAVFFLKKKTKNKPLCTTYNKL